MKLDKTSVCVAERGRYDANGKVAQRLEPLWGANKLAYHSF